MSPRYRFDAEDPFGTRPDEKPPEGWDTRFWEEVLERIQHHGKEPEPPGLPEPPRRERGSTRTLAIVALITLAAAATGALLSGAPSGRLPGSDDPPPTVVRVSGLEEPAVAVEWARSGGCRSGYVILQSFEPEISYVVIDRRLVSP